MPRCKNCKDKFIPKFFLQKFCAEKEECIGMEIQLKKDSVWKEKRAEWKINTHSKEHKADLQKEINKLSKMIDAYFGFTTCIDCEKGFGKQIDAAHFYSVGSNSSLRYNLHILHSANSQCNQFSDKHKEGYVLGLEKRYGRDYLNMVFELPLKYKEIKLSNIEIYEKLAQVRKLIRNFNTFKFKTPVSARNILNILIGIYK